MGLRAYHRVDPLMDERKSHYSPAQLGAYLKVQLVAGRQAQRGTFRSLDSLRAALPNAYARHIDFLVKERDLVVRKDGTVYVDGWQEWQEGDLTVGERMARLRDKRRRSVTPDDTDGGVTPPSRDRNNDRNNDRNGAVTQPSLSAIGVGVGVSTSVENGLTRPSTTPGAGAVERPVDPLEEEAVPWLA